MKVIRERPCQRRHHRVTAPMRVTLPDGQTLQASDWSLGGLRLDGTRGSLPAAGSQMHLALELPFQGFNISFDVAVAVIRTEGASGTLVVEFLELGEREHDLMKHFIDDLVRGKMATVDDSICRIDVPVTPISTKPDPNPSEALPVRRIPFKTIFMSLFYTMLGVSVFGYLLLLTYSNTMRLEVDSAVVSSPLATVKMPMDGLLVPVRLRVDEEIQQGQAIARIVNTKLESELDDRKIAFEQAKARLTRAQEKYRIESERMKLYQVINRTDRQIAEARLDAAREALAAADAGFERLAGLKDKGLITASKFDEAGLRRAEAESRVREAEYALERTAVMDATSERRYYNHKEFVSDLDMLALEIEEAASDVKTAQMQLEKYETLRASLTITAPFDGRIVSVSQPGGMTVLRNEPLFTIEQRQAPTVTAFLDQKQVLSVGLSDNASVYFPSPGRSVEATVVKIDRNSAFLNSDASRYVWKEGKEKSAAVSLMIDAAEYERGEVRSGLPAVVVFPRRRSNDIVHAIVSAVGLPIGGARADGSVTEEGIDRAAEGGRDGYSI